MAPSTSHYFIRDIFFLFLIRQRSEKNPFFSVCKRNESITVEKVQSLRGKRSL